MEQRVSLITLGVADVHRARAFYHRMGWVGQETEETVFIQAGGIALVVWGRDKLARDCAVSNDKPAGFSGIVLAHNVRSKEEVDHVIAAAEGADEGTGRRDRDKGFGCLGQRHLGPEARYLSAGLPSGGAVARVAAQDLGVRGSCLP